MYAIPRKSAGLQCFAPCFETHVGAVSELNISVSAVIIEFPGKGILC